MLVRLPRGVRCHLTLTHANVERNIESVMLQAEQSVWRWSQGALPPLYPGGTAITGLCVHRGLPASNGPACRQIRSQTTLSQWCGKRPCPCQNWEGCCQVAFLKVHPLFEVPAAARRPEWQLKICERRLCLGQLPCKDFTAPHQVGFSFSRQLFLFKRPEPDSVSSFHPLSACCRYIQFPLPSAHANSVLLSRPSILMPPHLLQRHWFSCQGFVQQALMLTFLICLVSSQLLL